MAIAVIPPGVYASALIETRTAAVNDLLSRERYVRAAGMLVGLCEVGSDRPISGQSPQTIRKQLEVALMQLRRLADQPFPAKASPAARVERAVLLVQLDRLDQAAELLRPLTPNYRDAVLLLATIYRDRESWAESDALYSLALDRLLPLATTNSEASSLCLSVFEGLTYNARMDSRPADAERLLRRGLAELPASAAYFHFQLGRHYQSGGRPIEALQHLETAAQLDPGAYGKRARSLIATINSHTPGCLLRGNSQRIEGSK